MKIELHSCICSSLTALYKRKNHDYGDSFGKSFKEYGMAMPCIRLEDKLNRLKALTRNGNQQVSDESIDDTLMDLANYAIMTLVERRIGDTIAPPKKSVPHDLVRTCSGCIHEDKKAGEFPCVECFNGNGFNEDEIYWEAKENASDER